jgi:MEDS: MEthanogen/methylotroph, DcmR Sensory domain
MTPSGIETLTNPQPCGHIVYPYTNEFQVSEAVCLFAGAGLRKGEAVLLVMTADHHKPVRERLEVEGFDLKSLEATGQLVCVDAKSLLESFMIDGIIDDLRFTTTVGNMIQKAKASGGKRRSVRAFGEMVDLIWTSRPTATQHLEVLWNRVIEAHSVPLLCAYSLGGSRPEELTESLISCHSHAVA